ncbi:MAG: MbcA/ParS/Xre antitoxin family protein, partial [Bdellovibrionales bacterium]
LKSLLGKNIGKPSRCERDVDEVRAAKRTTKLRSSPRTEKDRLTIEQKSVALHAFMREHYTQWLDTPLPTFNGKSPRQMVKTREGREQIIDLLKEIESGQQRTEKGGNIEAFDFLWLWQELGLKRDAA